MTQPLPNAEKKQQHEATCRAINRDIIAALRMVPIFGRNGLERWIYLNKNFLPTTKSAYEQSEQMRKRWEDPNSSHRNRKARKTQRGNING